MMKKMKDAADAVRGGAKALRGGAGSAETEATETEATASATRRNPPAMKADHTIGGGIFAGPPTAGMDVRTTASFRSSSGPRVSPGLGPKGTHSRATPSPTEQGRRSGARKKTPSPGAGAAGAPRNPSPGAGGAGAQRNPSRTPSPNTGKSPARRKSPSGLGGHAKEGHLRNSSTGMSAKRSSGSKSSQGNMLSRSLEGALHPPLPARPLCRVATWHRATVKGLPGVRARGSLSTKPQHPRTSHRPLTTAHCTAHCN